MKRTALVITLSLILLFVGYLAYQKYYQPVPVSLWDHVPGNAVLVFEDKNAAETWNNVQKTSIWKSLNQIEAFENLKKDLELLDSIDGKTGSIATILDNDNLFSLHVTGKNTFDWIFYVDMSSETNQRIATRLLDHFKNAAATFSERTYQGVKISELTSGKNTFTYHIDRNIFIGSFTSFLVEDVVRLINDDFKTSFKVNNPLLFKLPKLAKDDGDIYLNMEAVALWLSSFVDPVEKGEIKKIETMSHSAFFDVSLSDDKILLNGFTISKGQSDYLNTLKGQVPVKSDVKYYIPNETAVLYQFGLSDPQGWHSALVSFWSRENRGFLARRKKFEQDYGLDFSQFYSWFGNNVDLAHVSASRLLQDKLIFVHTNDITEALHQLNSFSEALAKVEGDSVYVENFSTYQIRELKEEQFTEYLLGPMFGGFEECYFMAVGDYIVFGNRMLALKNLIEAIENENTWGRSVIFNRFLESNLEESNLSLIFNTNRVWEDLLPMLDSRWRKFARENADQLKDFNFGSIQFSRLDDNFYTSIALRHEEQERPVAKQNYEILLHTTLKNKIVSKPFVVKNHTTGDYEVVVQDSALNFILIGAQGNILWKDSLLQPIVSDIEQIDYYKNDKLQYFFATHSALHIIDRLGNYVEGYPLRLEHNVKYASVVDYDKSKRYRFLLSDEWGNLWLYNKEGVNLEGWTPRKLTGKLASRPFHLRVRGKDCIVGIQQNGIINVMNRRGEMMPGFPLELSARIDTQPFVRIGSDFKKTILTILTREGRIVNFNLEGTIISTEQLYKPTPETIFTLVPDALGKNYLIARQDLARLVLLNPDKEEVLSKDYLNSEDLQVQYYDFSADHQIYAITDKTQEFTYIYNKDGKLISSTPIDSEHEVGLIYFEAEKKYRVYATAHNNFKLLGF